jgi:vitamin B12 transporter
LILQSQISNSIASSRRYHHMYKKTAAHDSWIQVFILLVQLFFVVQDATSQSIDYFLRQLEIIAERYSGSFVDMSKSVSVLDSLEISRLPVGSSTELLAYCQHVELQHRGAQGIQSDISLRGGSFQDMLILLDGVRINDPQTGHHNLDLPVSLDDIERIEIIHGSGSAVYGADAMCGVIHIFTKTHGNKLRLRPFAGQYGLYGLSASTYTSVKKTSHRLSAEIKQCDGYRYNTDFKQANIFYSSSIPLHTQMLNVRSGYQSKWFGANGFYSPLFPEQRENTHVAFLVLNANLEHRHMWATPTFSWRRHFDDFKLDRTRPQWYHNRHITNSMAVEIPMHFPTKIGLASAGLYACQEWIASGNLGDHRRQSGGGYAGLQTWLSSRLVLNSAVTMHYYDRWAWKLWPEAGLSFLFHNVKLFTSFGRSFRIPTFTELYYNDPANVGNPELKFSHSQSGEIGLEGRTHKVNFSATAFVRDGRNIIDWMRHSSKEPWQVMNIVELQTEGIEASIKIDMPESAWLESLSAAGSWLESKKNSFNYESKYALNFLKYHLHLHAGFRLPWHIVSDVYFNWQERNQGSSYPLLDFSVHKSLDRYQFYCRITNLTNTSYEEVSGVPMPGRWVEAGVTVTVK